jgi:hypothetical protein
MSDVRELPEQTPRIETGPTRFGTDWCGVFIRGDGAFGYALAVEAAMMWVPDDSAIVKGVLNNLLTDLRSCDERMFPRKEEP